MEKALGKCFPQMEVRFKDVSISVDIVVKDTDDIKTELPTLTNAITTKYHEIRSTKNVVKQQILKNVSGVFKPGTMTLMLGQPGSGKSSLMKLLSGRFPKGKNISIEGEVLYNGTPAAELSNQLPHLVSYVPQRDEHYSLLTVNETMKFAHACCGGDLHEHWKKQLVNGTPEENSQALDALQKKYQNYSDEVIGYLGLKNCQNTIVGDAMLR
ncbi:Hypothetical protein PHPALM_4408, partial [Phytophthora palmivora]